MTNRPLPSRRGRLKSKGSHQTTNDLRQILKYIVNAFKQIPKRIVTGVELD